MGIRTRVMRGGRAAIATMSLSTRAFPGLERSVRFDRVMFSSVGAHHIKCLKPHDLFCLPLVDIRGCESKGDIEERIRSAWRARIERLAGPWDALHRAGTRCSARAPDSAIRLPIEGEAGDVQATLVEPGEIVLPGRGPLRGLGLRSRDERVFKLGTLPATDIELQIAITNHIEQLASAERARLRHESSFTASTSQSGMEVATVGVRSHRILLVGPHLSRDRKAIDSLALRGYTVEVARSATEATRLYQRCSPELVITEANLGRSEGLELVPMLAAASGIEHIPVIVVDEQHHAARRSAAERIGARGYIAGPLKIARIAERLARIIDQPGRRRFTRYAELLTVRVGGAPSPATATALSRGGLYLATDQSLPASSLQRCELLLADTGRAIEVEAEVLYRLGSGGRDRGGVGLRFDRFGADGEGAYLDFLSDLQRGRS
jgi:two-component system cell cycle response regulator DivK